MRTDKILELFAEMRGMIRVSRIQETSTMDDIEMRLRTLLTQTAGQALDLDDYDGRGAFEPCSPTDCSPFEPAKGVNVSDFNNCTDQT